MLIIDNRTQETLITMRECIEVQEDAFRKLAEGVAAHRPRIDVYVPCASDDSYYRWGSMEGAYNGIYACRVKSDIVSWPSRASGQTEEWHCIRPGTYCGLILLFSTDNGEPLAILNDGTIQHVRVGGGAGNRRQVSCKSGRFEGWHAWFRRYGSNLSRSILRSAANSNGEGL